MSSPRTIKLALTTLCVLAFGVPFAFSQAPSAPAFDPCYPVNDASPQGKPCDTPETAVAQQGSTLWTRVGGAKAHEADVVPGSPTRFIDDLYAVAARNTTFAFAGGAACENPADDPVSCTRHPVMYRYADTDGHGPRWQREPDFPAAGEGFVGAISYIPGTDRFLAVGGNGAYPRRERETGAADQAGMGRAWLFDGEHWQEITDQLPPSLRGMTALDFSPTPAPDTELGVAGALGQLVEWHDGVFTDVVDAASPRLEAAPEDHVGGASGTDVTNGDPTTKDDFRFRVRDIRALVSDNGAPRTSGRFIAVTAGCCVDQASVDPSDVPANRSMVLADVGSRWRISSPQYYDAVGIALSTNGQSAYVSNPRLVSAYAVRGDTGAGRAAGRILSVLMNADGPEGAAEPPSEVASPRNTLLLSGDPLTSGMRLVSADGMSSKRSGDPYDWYVGVDRNTGHGIAYGTGTEAPKRPGGGVCVGPQASAGTDCSKGDPTTGDQPTLNASQEQRHQGSYRLLDLGTYGLNAFRVDNGETTGGSGWAVGDRGAIVRLGESVAQSGTEPAPPKLSPTGAQPLEDASPYNAFRPLVTGLASGGVPALATQPLEALTRPGPVAAGSPDPAAPPFADVTSIVMSRHGDEAWAVGGTSGLGMFHYDGVHWSRCDPLAAKPDPRCSALRNLAGNDLRILTASRVPLEYGDDPSQADEFEIVAVAKYGANRRVLLRFRDGVWGVDNPAATKAVTDTPGTNSFASIAFTAPNDGWLVTSSTSGGFVAYAPIFHYDGQRWVDCAQAAAVSDLTTCSDGGKRLPALPSNGPVSQSVLRLTTVGRRVYLSGARVISTQASNSGFEGTYPLILYRDPGSAWTAADGGYDPAIDQKADGGATAAGDPAQQGWVESLTVTRGDNGGYQGWAVGFFGGTGGPGGTVTLGSNGSPNAPVVADARLMRQAPGSHDWTEWRMEDAASDYLAAAGTGGVGATPQTASLALVHSPIGSAVIAPASGPLLSFDDTSDHRWRVLAGPVSPTALESRALGRIQALADDGNGGFWAAAGSVTPGPDADLGTWFYHYTDRAPRPIFDDVAQPLDRPITAVAGASDGTVWASTDSDVIARYDRLTGWETMRIPGWDPGRLVTATSSVRAIALAPDGSGLAVGAGGRIAELGRTVKLNAASGAPVCGFPPAAPICGTGRTLWSAAIAPDGSALVGGDALTLLWRPAGGSFQTISRPAAAAAARITGIAMPTSDRAWLTVNSGQVFFGERSGSVWSWTLESIDAKGDSLTNNAARRAVPLRAIAVDASGAGFAVGDDGLVLDRDPARGSFPWQRLDTGVGDDLTSVVLPAGGGSGALIGGANGLILTLDDGRLAVARQADHFTDPRTVTGLALLPGVRAGQTEAWAALSGPEIGSELLHYASTPDEPLLNPGARTGALPDVPDARPGEISIAALGKSDCHRPPSDPLPCDAISGLGSAHDVEARRIVDAVIAASQRPGGPQFAVFTGDINDSSGRLSATQLQTSSEYDGVRAPAGARTAVPNVANWAELVGRRLRDGGMPLFSAIGSQDVTSDAVCLPSAGCFNQKQATGQEVCAESQCAASAGNANTNLLWREALRHQPAPWGDGPPAQAGQLSFVAVPDPTASVGSPVEGARTHYAVDVEEAGRKLARLVVVDNSQRSLTASDPAQDPVESSGQSTWLQDVLCVGGPGCTRVAGQRAIVVANTPTYSYGPGAGTGTATDASTFEATLIANHADLVISGRLGWNALYYALAAGLHYPCPGGQYPEAAPNSVSACGAADTSSATDTAPKRASKAAKQLSDALTPLGAPAVPDPGTVTGAALPATGVLPFVVASGAGGRLTDANVDEGRWHGYTIVRIDPDGDGGKTIVEQRPIFDWVRITASSRVVRPGQQLNLHGAGREPPAIDEAPRVDTIDSPAITHRFDLLAADPDAPYRPALGADGGPVALDPTVATIDHQTGKVTAQRTPHGRIYAIALLSVGDLAATYPVVFESARSYKPTRVRIATPPIVPRIRTLGFTAQSLTAPPAAAAPTPPPLTTSLSLPTAPTLPTFPTASTPPATPPVPPAPPAPPAQQSAPPLSLGINAVNVVVPPTPGVTVQPTPPVNPAPPGGARREAKQRQAATAKSEEGGGDESAAQQGGGDLANRDIGAHGSAMTRLEQRKPNAFTAMRVVGQQSAWVRDLVWGGGLGLGALFFAAAFLYAQPRSRRRSPRLPAPSTIHERIHR